MNGYAVTGLSRFDKLPKHPQKKSRRVLILPTWRDWLSNASPQQFKKSQYFNKIHSLITSDSLNRLLEDNDFEADICLHHKMHSYLSLLPKSERIRLHSMNDVDVQSLITSSDIMITDYSSASFDMLYQRKPVLYYWFDSQKFFATRGGPLVCPRTGIPGPVLTKEDALISTLGKYIEKDFSLDKSFAKIANKFFSYRDNNNTKRILELIE